MRKKERFVLGKRTFRSQKSKHFVLRIIDEYLDIEPDADVNQIEEDSLDEESNRTVHSIMKTFNLTWKEALEEFITYTYKAGDTEGGAIWL